MRHGKRFNHLGRKTGHRKALLKNMANSLIEHKRINTTLAKARALRKYVEPLITKSKNDTTHSRRVVFSYLQNKESIKELFGPIAVKVGDRPGGYIRIIKTGFRMSDGAEMAMIELVDFNEVLLAAAKEGGAGASKGKKRRTRRGSKKNVEGGAAAVATVTEAEEETTTEIVEDVEAVAAVAAETAEVVEEALTEEATEEVENKEATEVVEAAVEEAEAPVETEVVENVEDTAADEEE
jgi:large subunit ribosomal protein L17